MKWFSINIAILVVILLSACKDKPEKEKESRVEKLPYYIDATYTPHWVNSEAMLNGFHKIPSFELINQMGDTITERDFKDKIYVTDFFFTSCPGICPKMTSNMLIVQEAFQNDDEIMLLSHSVTPEYDSIPVLKSYAEAKGVLPNKWFLATGEREEIYNLGRNSYFVEENLGEPKGPDDFLHTENFILVDKNRHIRGIYNGLNKTAIRQLIADIKTLKRED